MAEPVIVLEDVVKRFRLYHDVISGPIKELLFFWQRERYYEEFLAVDGVSFSIERGEVVGLIGPNGSGKTTILKMIAGLLEANEGRLDVRGKVTALLAQGVGVHPEFTGRENVLYGGMLLGMSKEEVLAKLEGIVAFAELGDFIDRPLRTYSSGMRARLLFAISMSIDPDILIVDEALATGDAYFLHKSSGRIRELCASGATILFVSHSIRQVQSLCSRVLVLERGELVFDGPVHEGTRRYIQAVHARTDEPSEPGALVPSAGTGEVELRAAYFRAEGERRELLTLGRPCELVLELRCAEAQARVTPAIRVYSRKSATTYAIFPYYQGRLAGAPPHEPVDLPAGESRVVLSFDPLVMGDGDYSLDVFAYRAEGEEGGAETSLACYEEVARFRCVYEEEIAYGRGTLTEIPVQGLRVEQDPA